MSKLKSKETTKKATTKTTPRKSKDGIKKAVINKTTTTFKETIKEKMNQIVYFFFFSLIK